MPSSDLPSASSPSEPVTVIGAGLAGTLMAIFLARAGHRVRVYERLPDLRREAIPAGRSINLALAARGIHALQFAGVMDQVEPLLIPMPGRMLHGTQGELTFIPYGQRDHEVIYSVSRPGLNQVLLDAAERLGVEIIFRHSVLDVDFSNNCIQLRDEAEQRSVELPLVRVIGADGAGSRLRRSLVTALNVSCSDELLEHGYKELSLSATDAGDYRMHRNALHIWPRGNFMLIALPDLGGTFTVTLFLPHQGAESFETLSDAARIDAFFSKYFSDARHLMPDLVAQFLAHPTGVMGTVRCERWSVADRLLLIGDAAHAITPFHGQGMNCAFEDCTRLDPLLREHANWSAAFDAFERERHVNTDAIADMAIENYLEMRDTVRDPKFQLQKLLSLELERRFPDRFVPRYSMVMFHDEIPYAVAMQRGCVQSEILSELTRAKESFDQIDYEAAGRLIQARLTPIVRAAFQ